jgi:hypothetical protein
MDCVVLSHVVGRLFLDTLLDRASLNLMQLRGEIYRTTTNTVEPDGHAPLMIRRKKRRLKGSSAEPGGLSCAVIAIYQGILP